MKRNILELVAVLVFLVVAGSESFAGEDWVKYWRYSSQNDSIRACGAAAAPKVVFMGNSITDWWVAKHPEFFRDNNFTGRGISGQTTAQMLARFREDVVSLYPEVVVINGGTNDIAENGGAYDEDRTLGNLISMAQLAEANGIGVVMSSVLPAEKFYWRPEIADGPERIEMLNKRIRAFAEERGYPYVDYYGLMLADNGRALNRRYTEDGVHPTHMGYDVMEEAVLEGIHEARAGAKPVVVRLWEDANPLQHNGLGAEAEKADGDRWIGMVASPELYVYPAGSPTGAALLMCPGGGYAGVALSHEGKELAGPLNKAGITLAVLKYRVPNGCADVPGEDVREALRLMREHAKEWGVDSTRIGIGGASAGGHLASTVATHPETDTVDLAFQVLLYPVISMREGLTHAGSRYNLLGKNPSDEMVDYYSNELHVGPTTPPAFIAVSGDDDVVDVGNSLSYFNALRANGVKASLHVYPEGGHGWGMRSTFAYSKQWMNELTAWIQALLD